MPLKIILLRDWSLLTGRGGYKTGGGGPVKFYPYKKGGAEKVLAILKGGTTSFGVVFSHNEGGGVRKVSTL